MAEAEGPQTAVEAEAKRHSYPVEVVIRLFKEKPLAASGAVIMLGMLILAIFADWIAPFGYNELMWGHFLEPPSAQFWLGTDNVGRDMLSRIIFGARISVVVGVSATGLGVAGSAFIGMLCGLLGGKFDIIVQRFVDGVICFPGLIVLVLVMSLTGTGITQLILWMGILGALGGSRLIRSSTMAIRENMYVEAARVVGCSTMRMVFRHILPNVFPQIIIIFSASVGGTVMMEAGLSFIGYGIPPPHPSWGAMLSQIGRQYFLLAPWLSVWPGLALTIFIFGANMLGDGLRDILDPRLRGGFGRYAAVKQKRGGILAFLGLKRRV